MKLVLFADQTVGKDIVLYLLNNYFSDIVLVVTITKNEIYHLVMSRGIPVSIFESQDKIISILPSGVDLGILAWWPKILKAPLLDVPQRGFINTHPSLLPYNRGKHYNFWALVEQAPFGVTLHKVDVGTDTGDIIAQKAIAYDWTDTGKSLYTKAQLAMLELFCQTYPLLREGSVDAISQDQNAGSFHHSSEIESASHIDLERKYKARDLLNLLRARTFAPHPGCWIEENGDRYEISINIRKIDK